MVLSLRRERVWSARADDAHLDDHELVRWRGGAARRLGPGRLGAGLGKAFWLSQGTRTRHFPGIEHHHDNADHTNNDEDDVHDHHKLQLCRRPFQLQEGMVARQGGVVLHAPPARVLHRSLRRWLEVAEKRLDLEQDEAVLRRMGAQRQMATLYEEPLLPYDGYRVPNDFHHHHQHCHDHNLHHYPAQLQLQQGLRGAMV